MYGQSGAATHEEYIERLDEPRRGELHAPHELIRTTVPRLAPTMENYMENYAAAQLLRVAAANPPGELAAQ